MFEKRPYTRASWNWMDPILVLLIAAIIYFIAIMGEQWQKDYTPNYAIDLSLWALPKYTLFSIMRNLASFVLSLLSALLIGYWAAKNTIAEKIIIPTLDILQSIPVLGFLPGLVLGLVALFPNSNTGLEISSIILIYTGSAWNLIFCFYSALKSMPKDLNDASRVMQLSSWQRFRLLEVPHASVALTWNSLLSVAGGWFFLIVCEAFTLGEQNFRLPGIGSYMAEAIIQDQYLAIGAGIAMMMLVIVGMDFLLWRPILAWVVRFQSDQSKVEMGSTEVFVKLLRRDSWILNFLRDRWEKLEEILYKKPSKNPLISKVKIRNRYLWKPLTEESKRGLAKLLSFIVGAALGVVAVMAVGKLIHYLRVLEWQEWVALIAKCFLTLLRVLLSVTLSSLWTVPLGIWIGVSMKRVRIFQPIVQILASFPAPMLFPLIMLSMLSLHFSFEAISVVLMMAGVQWYILFNVIAGAINIPVELDQAARVMGLGFWRRMKSVYLPSIFPSLVTGGLTATGGAWNSSIIAEYVYFRGDLFTAYGLGATISKTVEHAQFPVLAASLIVMVLVIVLMNRLIWAKLYQLAESRYLLK